MILLIVFVAAVVALLGTCAYVGRMRAWGSWVALLGFSGVNSSRTGHASGVRIEGPAELCYSGGGKVELGDFSIRIFDPVTRTTLKSDFQLEGTTVSRDEEAFQKFMRNNRRFFREQVTVAIRACNQAELADHDLKLVERKLVSRVNLVMGRRFLDSVRMREYKLYESTDNVFVPVEPPANHKGG